MLIEKLKYLVVEYMLEYRHPIPIAVIVPISEQTVYQLWQFVHFLLLLQLMRFETQYEHLDEV